MLKIGITGGIGSGKSFVSKVLESFGYPVFYSDSVAKEIISTNKFVKEQLISFFGEKVFIGHQFNRSYLAKIIFNDKVALEKINQLVHPLVRKAFDDFTFKQKSPLVFNEAAILFESGGAIQFDKVILVIAPKKLRIRRVKERDGVSEKEILERMDKQWSDEKKIKLADYVIQNGDHEPLLTQIEKILEELKKENRQ